MFREASQAAEAVARQEAAAGDLKRIGAELRRRSPRIVITCARGSSDHAATFASWQNHHRVEIQLDDLRQDAGQVRHAHDDFAGTHQSRRANCRGA